MAELKTKKSTANVEAYIAAQEDSQRREDGTALLKIFAEATGESAAMWGEHMIGFGSYHYKSERSTQEGDWPLTAFALRKQNITLYIMAGFTPYATLLSKLGKHRTSKGSCLYINKLSDIDTKVLKELIQESVGMMRKRYNGSSK